ncbi:MAG: hypothetical protein AAGD86_05495 [Pseudomonadota bacterium]
MLIATLALAVLAVPQAAIPPEGRRVVSLQWDTWNGRPVLAEDSSLRCVVTPLVVDVASVVVTGPNGQTPAVTPQGDGTFAWSIALARAAGEPLADDGDWTIRVNFGDGLSVDAKTRVEVVSWAPLNIGAGGFVTGADAADDDTLLFRTDTSGTYLWDPQVRRFVDLVGRIDPALVQPFDRRGTFEALVGRNDSSRIWLLQELGRGIGFLFRSDDRGETFTLMQSGFAFEANGGALRLMNQHADVDPIDPDHLVFGDQDALYRTTDGGKTVQPIATVPAPVAADAGLPGFTGVKFDRFGPQSGGTTQRLMVNAGGRFFLSTDGGASFAEVTDGASAHTGFHSQQGEWLPDGRYLTHSRSGVIASYNAATDTWTDHLNDDNWRGVLHFEPGLATGRITRSRLSVVGHSRSGDGGVTWSQNFFGKGDVVASANRIPWHSLEDDGYLHNDSVTLSDGTVWLAGGNRGIPFVAFETLWERTGALEPVDVVAEGVGIEQICPNELTHVPGTDKLFVGFWDETVGILDASNERYPTEIGALENDFGASWGTAVSPQDPKLWVALPSWDEDDIALGGWTSTDAWETRVPFANAPGPYPNGANSYRGTDAAVSGKAGGPNGIVIAHGGLQSSSTVQFSTDLGTTWADAFFGAPINGPAWGARRTFELNRHILRADPTVPGRFWLYLQNDSPAGGRGFWRSDDYGATFEQTRAGLPPFGTQGAWNFNAMLEVPVSGHLWITAGAQTPADVPSDSLRLLRSFDGGESFEPVPRVTEPDKLSFGAPAPDGSGYPMLYFVGWVDLTFGVWMSPDADAAEPTFVQIGRFANDNAASLRSMAANRDRPGVVYTGHACSGGSYGDFSRLLQ